MNAELFWARVGSYNEALWPVQAVLTVVAAFLTYRVVAKPGPKTDVWVKVFLVRLPSLPSHWLLRLRQEWTARYLLPCCHGRCWGCQNAWALWTATRIAFSLAQVSMA
jgi:hypothetical protein